MDLIRLTNKDSRLNKVRGVILNELVECNMIYNGNKTMQELKDLSAYYCKYIGNYSEKTIEMAFDEYRLTSHFPPVPAAIRERCNSIAGRPKDDHDLKAIPAQTTINESENQEGLTLAGDSINRLRNQLGPDSNAWLDKRKALRAKDRDRSKNRK